MKLKKRFAEYYAGCSSVVATVSKINYFMRFANLFHSFAAQWKLMK